MVASAASKATAKAKASAASAKESPDTRAAHASTLLEKSDILEAPPAKRKNTADFSVAAIVAKSLRDNFCSWGEDLVDLTIIDGMSLRQRITDDKEAMKKGRRKAAMGKCYYADLRRVYEASASPEKMLTVENENEPEDGKLVASRTPLFARRRNFEPIMTWLASADRTPARFIPSRSH